ncbi:MAG: hypothetical protein ACRC28_00745, partial [Clostridium sp.]|uniref:hypothetical protein n=1 Tax=Clostridium sp. TaxID=1506 RepID=UPI003F3316BD
MKDNFDDKNDDKNDKGKCIEFRSNDWEAEERRRAKQNRADFEKHLKEKKFESDIPMEGEFELSKEIFDEFLAGVEKSFKKDCKRKMEWSLEEIISHLKKDEIKAKLTTLSIGYLKGDRKVQLVKHYLKNYEKSYKELFQYITEDVYKDLMKLKIQEYNIDLDLIEELKYPGLLDILGIGTIGINEEGDIRYFIPKEIASVIENYSFDKENMKKNDLILKITKGLLRVYGVIPKEKLMGFLIEYKVIKKDEDLETINAIIKMNIAAEESLIFTEDYYLDSAIAFVENLRMVMDRKGEYKRFTKKEVLEIKPMEEEIRKSSF